MRSVMADPSSGWTPAFFQALSGAKDQTDGMGFGDMTRDRVKTMMPLSKTATYIAYAVLGLIAIAYVLGLPAALGFTGPTPF